MKKRISKLDDLVHAARNEAPVVSFEETARQLKALAEKRRKPLWMWLAGQAAGHASIALQAAYLLLLSFGRRMRAAKPLRKLRRI